MHIDIIKRALRNQ